jgi:hypothetical protein
MHGEELEIRCCWVGSQAGSASSLRFRSDLTTGAEYHEFRHPADARAELDFLYGEHTHDGKVSRFNKSVRHEAQ